MKWNERHGSAMHVKPTEWPSFQSALLQDLSSGFLRRAKAIAYQSSSFELSRRLDGQEGEQMERLDADVEWSPRFQMRLSAWEDGVMWLRIGMANSYAVGGWKFLVAFHGHLEGLSAQEAVRLFEQSMIGSGGQRSDAVFDRLSRLWHAAEPRIDPSHDTP